MTRKRKIIYFTIMMMIPIFFTELTLQAYYRIMNGRFLFERMALPIYSADDYRYYKLKPNLSYRHRTNEYDVTYYTNSQGFRTNHLRKDINIDKDEETFRLLFLGPSFAFGWANNYEDTYASIIAENIAVNGKDTEIMNLGTPAQPIEYQLCWLQRIGYKFNPDFIIQTVYGNPSNIPTNCQEPLNPPIVQGGYLYSSEITLRKRLFNLVKNSAIVFYGWYLYQSIISTYDYNVGLGTELYKNNLKKSSAEEYRIRADTYSNYVSFVRKTVKREIPILFLHIPFSYVVRPADLSRWKHRGWANPYMLRRIAKETETLLEEQGIPFVNPINELISKDEETRMYYFLDIHSTPSGNKVIAEKVIPIIHDLIFLNANKVQN